jgi:hypothetical protein
MTYEHANLERWIVQCVQAKRISIEQVRAIYDVQGFKTSRDIPADQIPAFRAVIEDALSHCYPAPNPEPESDDFGALVDHVRRHINLSQNRQGWADRQQAYADGAQKEADESRIIAGKALVRCHDKFMEAKRTEGFTGIAHGNLRITTWKQFIAKKFPKSESEIRKLMRIARSPNPVAALKRERKAASASMKKTREKRSNSQRVGPLNGEAYETCKTALAALPEGERQTCLAQVADDFGYRIVRKAPLKLVS